MPEPSTGAGRRRNISAQPFLTDAAKATEPIWVAQYLADIQKIVDKVKGV